MTDETKVSVKAFLDSSQLAKDIAVSEADLDTAMIKQASMTAHYGAQAARATQQAALLKVRLKTVEARVYKELREHFLAKGTKVTEAMMKAEVTADPRVLAAEAALINAEQQAELGKVAFESFRQRRDMIVQLSKNRLEEMKGEMTLTLKNELREQMQGELDQLKKKALEVVSGQHQ